MKYHVIGGVASGETVELNEGEITWECKDGRDERGTEICRYILVEKVGPYTISPKVLLWESMPRDERSYNYIMSLIKYFGHND